MELVHQHGAEVSVVQPRYRRDAQKTLAMTKDVVVVQLISLLPRSLNSFGKLGRWSTSSALKLFKNLVIR